MTSRRRSGRPSGSLTGRVTASSPFLTSPTSSKLSGKSCLRRKPRLIFYFILEGAFITCFVGAYLRGGFGWRWKHQLRGVCNNVVQGKNTDKSIQFLYFDNQLVSYIIYLNILAISSSVVQIECHHTSEPKYQPFFGFTA